MTLLTTVLMRGALAVAISGSTLHVASTASADVVCNRWGDCWRVRERLAYPAGVGMTFHNDAWGFAHRTGRWHWRSDRGAYRNAVWIAY